MIVEKTNCQIYCIGYFLILIISRTREMICANWFQSDLNVLLSIEA